VDVLAPLHPDDVAQQRAEHRGPPRRDDRVVGTEVGAAPGAGRRPRDLPAAAAASDSAHTSLPSAPPDREGTPSGPRGSARRSAPARPGPPHGTAGDGSAGDRLAADVLDVDTHRGVRVEPHPVRWWRGSAGEELGVAGVGEVVAERFGELAELGGCGGVEEGVELWEVVGG
jgi:hypothetical protein